MIGFARTGDAWVDPKPRDDAKTAQEAAERARGY